MPNSLKDKELKQTPKTINFIKEVKSLIETGEIESYAAIAAKLDWSSSMISNIINGRQNVPNDRYRKFTEVYLPNKEMVNVDNEIKSEKSTTPKEKNVDEQEKESSGSGMSVSKEKFYMDTITDLRHTAIELANANKDACVANKEASVANRILAENQRELIEILKKMHSPIANAAKEIPRVGLSAATRDLMAARGILQGLWKSMDEGIAKLGILAGEDEATKQE